MAITIANLRFSPYTQKDLFKPVFGATLDFQFILPTQHQAGDRYCLGCDWERVVYPPSRPLSAYTEAFTIEDTEAGSVLSMSLTFTTNRFRGWVCKLRKPTPITLQLVRIRGSRQETLLLDDILALPSVVDGNNTVCEGDPLAELLEAKMDKPAEEGEEGQFLSLDENGQTVWATIPEQAQTDWDESDSSSPAYLRNKPDLSVYAEKADLATVATSGSYNDLKDKPEIPAAKVQANWDESDSADVSYIQGKPDLSVYAEKSELATVATSGNYSDLDNTPDLSAYVEKEEGKGLSTNDFTDAEKNKLEGIENGAQVNVQADWDASDSGDDAYVRNKPSLSAVATTGDYADLSNKPDLSVYAEKSELATVATSGSYNDLTDKPEIPAAQVQADWDESDSQAVDFIKNKPVLATVATSGSYNDLQDKPVQKNADWDESDSSDPAYIENKPDISGDIGAAIAEALTFHNN